MQDLADSFEVATFPVAVEIGSEFGGGWSTAEDCGFGRDFPGFAESDDVVGFPVVHRRVDVDFHVDGPHAEALRRRGVFGRAVRVPEDFRRSGQPGELQFVQIPQVLVSIDDQCGSLGGEGGRAGGRGQSGDGGLLQERTTGQERMEVPLGGLSV